MASEEIAIRVENVSKTFRLPHERKNSIKGAFINLFRKTTYEKQEALKDVSFEIKKGEFFGIVGRNGSGKSTLLKLIAGIYTPTNGNIHVSGSLTPFIELGVGFNPELTGRENVFLNGALFGLSRKEMGKLYDDIVEFAELEKFMDQKLKNYSSGMQVRLAFSIAIRTRSEILILDEVLAVGDLDFQKKCYSYFYDLKKQGRSIVLVSHDMSAIRKFCSRCILVNNGVVEAEGEPDEIALMYEDFNLRAAEKRLSFQSGAVTKKKKQGNQKAIIAQVETFNCSSGLLQNTFNPEDKIGVRIKFESNAEIPPPAVGFIFQNESDLTVFATNNQILGKKTKRLKKGKSLILETVINNVFTDGEHTITAAIESEDFEVIYDRVEYVHRFIIGGHKLSHALTHPEQKMEITYGKSQ